MTLTLPATYLVELIERRIPAMLLEASVLATQGTDMTINTVYPFYNAAAPDRSWQVIHQTMNLSRDRAAADQYLSTHSLVLRFIAAAVDGGFWGAYPSLYNVFAPTIVGYFTARPRFIYQQGQANVPYLAPEQTAITSVQFFGDTLAGQTPVQGMDFNLSVAFRIKNELSAVNP